MHRALPVRSVKDLVELAKRYPGELSFASPGHGSTPHLALELLKMRAGSLNVLHIPYRGMAPAVLEVLGGQVHALVSTLPPAIPHIRSGRLRPIAVAMEMMGGEGPYPFALGAQDQYLSLLMAEAARTGETVRSMRQPWAS